jgi:hypothetical protein
LAKGGIMPRLTDDKIKAGILHADVDVRFAVLHYFADCYSPDPTVMPVAIEAIERFGRTKVFRFIHPIAYLAQTETTIQWAVQELKTQPRHSEDERNYVDHICRLLCQADPRLVHPFAKDILAAPTFELEYREKLTRRLKLLTWDGETLWRELETICEEGKDEDCAGDIRWNEADDIAEAMGRQGGLHVDRMMDFLRQEIKDDEINPQTWMEPLVVKLAGELRYAPAIPLILAKLHKDAEVLSGECQKALAMIGGDDVIRAIQKDYPTAEWHYRLYASGVLGRVHTDLAVQAVIELLPQEKDGDLENWLAQALVSHFSTEGNEVARQVLLEDPDLHDLRDDLVAACTLMGQDFLELAEWRQEAEEEKRRKPLLYGGAMPSVPRPSVPATPALVAPIHRAEKRVGRNETCPCGSGKKFKKCCKGRSKG